MLLDIESQIELPTWKWPRLNFEAFTTKDSHTAFTETRE